MQTGLTAKADSRVERPNDALFASQRQCIRRFRQLGGAALLSLICLLSMPVAAASPGVTPLEEQTITTEATYPSANTQHIQQSAASATSAADLSLFGILALGIIGLLWVRRHTSEL